LKKYKNIGHPQIKLAERKYWVAMAITTFPAFNSWVSMFVVLCLWFEFNISVKKAIISQPHQAPG
jgi:hypothetical protein